MNKTKWYSKLVSLAVGFALVFSLVGIAVLPTSPVLAAGDYAELSVNITAPAQNSTVCTCTSFNLTFTVENTGTNCTATNVMVLVTASPPGATTVVQWNAGPWASIAAGENKTGTVEMHCAEPGWTVIHVDPTGKDACTGLEIVDAHLLSDLVGFWQKDPACLEVLEVTSDLTANTASTLQSFNITAIVHNKAGVDGADAENVTAALEIVLGESTGTANITAGPSPDKVASLAHCENATFTWAVNCTGAGDVKFKVTPAGIDTCTDEEITDTDCLVPGYITITQETKAHLEVTSVTSNLTNDTASTEQSFNITATVHNAGGAVAQNVTAALEITGNASAISGPSPDKVASLAGCHNATFTWAVNCTGEGVVTFAVTPWGIDKNTGENITAANIESGSLNVTQEEKAHLKVTITTPVTCTNITACNDFTVTAVVANTGNATAKDVTATLTISDTTLAHWVSGADPQPLGNIAGGANATATWTLHCDAAGDVIITVTPAGTDENTDEAIPQGNLAADKVTIHQIAPVLPAPTLVAPAKGATVKSLPVTFDWEDVTGVCNATYTLIVHEKDHSDIIAVNATGLTESTYIQDELFNDNWGWYVIVYAAGQSAQSETWYFKVDVTEDTTPPSVTVTRPNGGEVFTGGEVQAITWSATDNVGVTSIKLEYSSNSGGSWTEIASGLSDSGSYAWAVPTGITSSQCLVRVTAADAAGNEESDTSNNVFTITVGVAVPVTVEAPAGVKTGANFTAQVSIGEVTDFDAADFKVVFDSSVLKAENITADITDGLIDTTTIPVVSANETSPGTLRIVVNVSGTPGVTGSGYLCQIRFHAIGAAGTSSTITLQNGTLSDKNGDAITAVWTGDSVNVLEYALGDANNDGVINALDITTVELMVGEVLTPTPEADINQDGAWNALDITLVEILVAEA